MAVERPDTNSGSSRHSLQARIRTTGAEDSLRGLQHALAIAGRVGAGLANRFCGRICHLTNLDHDLVRLNRIIISSPCLSTIFSENQFRFLIMLGDADLAKRRMPPYMPISARLGHACRSTPAAAIQVTIALIGALHESPHQPYR
jgi:hypothetical protein